MHGVRRGRQTSPIAVEEERRQASIAADLIRRALTLRQEPLPDTLCADFRRNYVVVESALESNPDEYTLWSFRKEVLLKRLSATCENDEGVSIEKAWEEELALTSRALRRHPKAYPAWQHRLWLLSDETISSAINTGNMRCAIDAEKKLSAYMLSKDGRNFHSWAHRMRVRQLLIRHNLDSESALERGELHFVEKKINEDFANYSAWHHRSVLLPRVQSENKEDWISSELEYVRQAFYTEPEVQSVWFYHRWLLAGAPARGSTVDVDDEVLVAELRACNELLEIEPEARHALQTKVHILLQLGRKAEANIVLDTLEEMDPLRKGYYRHLRK